MDLSAGSLLASLLVSSVGCGLFLYGKKQERLPQLLTGIALSIYPYFIGNAAWMVGIAGALLAAMLLALRSGL